MGQTKIINGRKVRINEVPFRTKKLLTCWVFGFLDAHVHVVEL